MIHFEVSLLNHGYRIRLLWWTFSNGWKWRIQLNRLSLCGISATWRFQLSRWTKWDPQLGKSMRVGPHSLSTRRQTEFWTLLRLSLPQWHDPTKCSSFCLSTWMISHGIYFHSWIVWWDTRYLLRQLPRQTFPKCVFSGTCL